MLNLNAITGLPTRLFGGSPAPAAAPVRAKPKKSRSKSSLASVTFAKSLSVDVSDASTPEISKARDFMQQRMALVPSGEALLLAADFMQAEYVDSEPVSQGQVESVPAFYIDRYAVSNEDYQYFVQDGGYSEMELWPLAVRPFVLKMVDQSGQPGPRFWNEGRFDQASASHPVVGVSWYEANAFATWAGRELLTSAQWQHAGTWSNTEAAARGEQKYPWGNNFDSKRANTWRGGIGSTVAVDDFYDGSTPNGVYQLIGNVWQWVTNRFDLDQAANEADPRSLLGEIRGGAFDTYFESQATCQFRTGQPLLHRRANIGFRCCLPTSKIRS